MSLHFFKKQKSGSPGVTNSISVLQPLMLPYQNIPIVRQTNKSLLIPAVRKALTGCEIISPICVVTAPNACDFVGHFDEKRVVYYCVDDFSKWPGLEHDLVLSMENDIIRKADLFFATSKTLKERLEAHCKTVTLLSHGIDLEMFLSPGITEHPCLASIPRPRIGYFGLFDERNDQQLLFKVAKSFPHVSFVVTGEVAVDTSSLQQIDNFYFTGKIPFVEIPCIAAGFDICMLPYIKSALTDAINPLKIKEYLASGKPVITTALRETSAFQDLLTTADGLQEWQRAIEENLWTGIHADIQAKRLEMLRKETWEKKSHTFFQLCSHGVF